MTYKCPICESDNTNKEYIDGITIGDRICGNCGFHGSAADFLHTKQNEDQKELIKFIDNTQMDPDVKLALQKVAIWDNIDAKPATLLKRAHECVDLHSNIIDKVPTDKRYNVIRDYIVEYKNRDNVLKDYDFIKNEKDVFYLIKPRSKSIEMIIFNGRSMRPFSENEKNTGFVWGYGGGGTYPTAKVILKECFPNKPFVLDLAGEFSLDMLNANKLTNDKNGIVKKQDVLDWYKNLNIVKRACKELGITQKELADRLGVSKPSVERWAQGETPDQAINHIHLLLENIALSKELDELKSALKTIAKYSNLS